MIYVRQTTKVTNTGVGFMGLLTILFVGLKLTNLIDWSWWWVLAPLWMPAAIVIGILVFSFLVWLALRVYFNYKEEQRRKKRLAK